MEDETDEVVEEVEEEDAPVRPKKKPKAPAKSKAKSSRPAKPSAQMRIVWVVMNDAYKPLATFDYTQKEAALAKAAELTAKGRGTHFVQRTKEAMPEDAPGLGAIIPRPEPPAPKKAAKVVEVAAAAAVVEDEEEFDDEEESELDMDEEPEDDEE